MIYIPSDELAYLPTMPEWLLARCSYCYIAYYSEYEALAAKYSAGNAAFYTANGLDYNEVNTMRAALPFPLPPIGGPFPYVVGPPKEPVGAQYCGLNEQSAVTRAEAATWALAIASVYATLLSQTFVRAFQFGYYGRKADHQKGSSQNG